MCTRDFNSLSKKLKWIILFLCRFFEEYTQTDKWPLFITLKSYFLKSLVFFLNYFVSNNFKNILLNHTKLGFWNLKQSYIFVQGLQIFDLHVETKTRVIVCFIDNIYCTEVDWILGSKTLLFIFYLKTEWMENRETASYSAGGIHCKPGLFFNTYHCLHGCHPLIYMPLAFYQQANGYAIGVFLAGMPERTVVWDSGQPTERNLQFSLMLHWISLQMGISSCNRHKAKRPTLPILLMVQHQHRCLIQDTLFSIILKIR